MRAYNNTPHHLTIITTLQRASIIVAHAVGV